MCLFVFVRVCATAASQPRQRRGHKGETGSIGEGANTHTSVLGEVNKGWKKRRQTKRKKQGEKGGKRLYPSVPGRQPSAQIGPMGTHSLYTCSNQLATTTCLSGGFTLRHTPTFAEVGECRQGSENDVCERGWKKSRQSGGFHTVPRQERSDRVHFTSSESI